MNKLLFFSVLILSSYLILNISCEKLDLVSITKISLSHEISDITNNSATIKSKFADVGAEIQSYGHCWSETQNPTISDSKTEFTDKPEKDKSIVSELIGLSSESKYYVKAYAIIENVPVYSNEVNFTTLANPLIVTTTAISAISQTSATTGGSVISDGGSTVTVRGVCWSTNQTPTILDNAKSNGSGLGSFVINIDGLSAATKYYVRAFATNTSGTTYGNEISFTTNAVVVNLPIVTTANINSITSSTAIAGGEITNDGGGAIIERGVCYSTTQNPTISDLKSTSSGSLGSYTCNLSGLSTTTTYYVRAFATNAAGTAYGNQVSFTTINIPSLNTSTITNITQTTATGGGNVTDDGGSTITARGICYSTIQNPTISDNKVTETGTTGSFISNITGLNSNTTYYVRAFATNTAGTAYGNQLSFTTLASVMPPTVTTTSISNITQNSATGGGNVTNDGGGTISERGVCYSVNQNPTISDDKIVASGTTGSFTSNFSGLIAGTTYYVRAYATNSAGTSYGSQESFITLNIPTVITNSISNITQTTASGGGNVTNDGGATVTARGVCWSTNQNPTISGNLTTNGSGTGSFTSSLSGLTSNTTYYIRAYATNSVGTAYGSQETFTTSGGCTSFQVTHTSGTVAPVTKTVTYEVSENSLTGSTKCWITQNLGADNQASSATDNTEASAGWYWQFNRKQGFKHDGTTRTPSATWITAIDENSDWLPANDPCALLLGSGWRLPTQSEYNLVDGNGNISNSSQAYSTLLKLHNAGNLSETTGAVINRGTHGYYWSSTQLNNSDSYTLRFWSVGGEVNFFKKYLGATIRCIRD
ncbi:MAG: hypothetical protein U0W24_22925 [Bacteroidales bacterium]